MRGGRREEPREARAPPARPAAQQARGRRRGHRSPAPASPDRSECSSAGDDEGAKATERERARGEDRRRRLLHRETTAVAGAEEALVTAVGAHEASNPPFPVPFFSL